MAFSLNFYPIVYRAKFAKDKWKGAYLEKPHKTPAEEAAMKGPKLDALIAAKNFYDDMPLISYTTQYGLSCFEGMKAYPQANGGLSLFRPEQNAARFARSMKGLYMPPFPEDMFLKAVVETVKRNAKLGFRPQYKKEWEKDSFANAASIYLRPYVHTEGGFGITISKEPYVVIVSSPVTIFLPKSDAGVVVNDRIRATPNGTGWIKSASNYVISTLAKHEANLAGFTETIFLDAVDRKYVEECSACNIFFYLKSGELVTPELGDTILPGITRASIVELARDKKIKASERKISIDEVMDEAQECFLCGTAVGLVPIPAITYKKKKVVFCKGQTGETTAMLRDTLKGIQYGLIPDTKGWMVKVV